MSTNCVTDIFEFMYQVMNLEVGENEYCNDELYDMSTDEKGLYEDYERQP